MILWSTDTSRCRRVAVSDTCRRCPTLVHRCGNLIQGSDFLLLFSTFFYSRWTNKKLNIIVSDCKAFLKWNKLLNLYAHVYILILNFKASAGNYYLDDQPTKCSKLAFQKFVFTKIVTTNARTEGKHQSLRNIYHHIMSILFILWSNVVLSGGGYIKLPWF